MNWYIFERSIETGTLILICLCLVSIMVAALYDMMRTNKRFRVPRVLQNQPHITVLVYAKTNASSIMTCLVSIMRNTYRHFDVVVVDDCSRDKTYAHAKTVQADVKGKLVVYKKRKSTSRQQTLFDAYKKSMKGEVVLVVSGDTLVSKNFLRQCAGEYRAFPFDALKLNTHYEVASRLHAVLPRFQQLSRQLQLKILSLLHAEKVKPGEIGTLYSKKAFLTLKKSPQKAAYSGHLVIELLQTPALFPKERPSLLYGGGILFSFAFVTYAIYLALMVQSPTLLFFSWAGVCLWLLGALWLDEAENTEGKFKLMFTLPPLYVFMYITALLQLVALPIRTFFNRG